MEITEINEIVESKKNLIDALRKEIGKTIIGQEYMVSRILIGLFTGGHLLLEGVPGLAKSLTVSTIAKTIESDFKRIQFTPDLLPADIIGTMIYQQKTSEFITRHGPIFSNIILADEINRAPAKVQAALLEAMQEKQVTIGETSYKLEEPFLVLATQNPIEQEGTYPLPEAQQDRFMMKLIIKYPKKAEEKIIMEKNTSNEKLEDVKINPVITKEEIKKIKDIVRNIYIDDKLKDYILDIVYKTRETSEYILCGASPRATVNIALAAKGKAFLEGRGYVLPDDIKSVVYDVLRHRIMLSYEAEAEERKAEDIIREILENTVLP